MGWVCGFKSKDDHLNSDILSEVKKDISFSKVDWENFDSIWSWKTEIKKEEPVTKEDFSTILEPKSRTDKLLSFFGQYKPRRRASSIHLSKNQLIISYSWNWTQVNWKCPICKTSFADRYRESSFNSKEITFYGKRPKIKWGEKIETCKACWQSISYNHLEYLKY